ncbi:hypothetical protein CBM2606_A180019 [Cupriavidus taiwanensis]|nr:hypothetical protein CBM2606_A180019 [Cupriavidus taiwanensis]
MHKYAIFCEITSDPRPILWGGRPYRSLARQPFGPGKSQSGGAARVSQTRADRRTGEVVRKVPANRGSGILRAFASAPVRSCPGALHDVR